MLKKTAAAIGIGTAALVMAAAPAMASDSSVTTEVPDQNFEAFNDLCALPWLWNGPVPVLTMPFYAACNDANVSQGLSL